MIYMSNYTEHRYTTSKGMEIFVKDQREYNLSAVSLNNFAPGNYINPIISERKLCILSNISGTIANSCFDSNEYNQLKSFLATTQFSDIKIMDMFNARYFKLEENIIKLVLNFNNGKQFYQKFNKRNFSNFKS